VTELKGKVDGLSTGIDNAADLRKELADLKELHGARLIRCEVDLDGLRTQVADLKPKRRR
jgi:hypothetical protein